MFAFQLDFVLFLMSLHVSDCSRRISGGKKVTRDLRYMVYLVKAEISPRKYDAWICGGAIVSSEFIITSAACVDDVQFLYAIAGYNKYVTDANIDVDPCTKEMKKKIIYTCIPVNYELKYEHLDKWSYIDVALVKVESPYDFEDNAYLTASCSYIPDRIPINFEKKYQEPGVDAMVAGWGHEIVWRKPGDTNNFNKDFLNYAPTLIYDKEQCKAAYAVYPNMGQVIDKYMICTLDAGNIDEKGFPIETTAGKIEGCAPSAKQAMMGYPAQTGSCENEQQDLLMDNTRREALNRTDNASMQILNETIVTKKSVNMNVTQYFGNITESKKRKVFNKTADYDKSFSNFSYTRRNGICQNDHGGPLVTWVGAHEVLIGIASVFKVSDNSTCIGPYLYTSTQCNGAFLDCVLNTHEFEKNEKNDDARRNFCDSPPSEKGFDTVETHISWMNHPAGPAENEKPSARQRIRADVPKYVANDKYTAKQQYQPKDTYAAANEEYPPKDTYAAANEQYPPKDTYAAANEQYPPKDTYAAANEQYPPKDTYAAANEQYPPKDMYAAANEEYPPKDTYAVANEQYPPKDAYVAANEQYQPKDSYAANLQNLPKDTYAANVQYPAKDTYAGNVQYPLKDTYAANAQYPPKDIFSANENYGANESPQVKFQPEWSGVNAGLAPNEMNEPKTNGDSDKFLIRPQRPLHT